MDYFEKKQWIRISVCTVLVAIAVLALTGVFGGNGPLVYDPSAVNGAAVSSAQASEQGFGGEVTARVALEDGKIKTLTIDTPNETEGLGKRASEEAFTDQFIGKSAPFTFGEDGIEALSGATVTSNAVLKAINRAAGAEETAEEPAAEPVAEPVAEPAAEPAAEPEAAADTTDAAEMGFGGDVTVHVTLDGGKIQTLTVDTPNETAGLGQRASETAFTDQFIGKSAPFTFGEDGIEALSGATVTSNAVLKAINRAAGAEETAEEPAAEPAAEPVAEPAAEPAAEPEAAADTTDAAEMGFGGDVTVHVTLDGGKIQTLTVDTPNETAGLGQRASEAAFTDQFIGKSAPFTFGEDGIEALSGATVTSNAVLKAINRAAGAETPAEAPAEEPAADPESKEEPKAEASDGQAYGVYRATAENAFSKVTVTASAKNGILTDVKITSEGEGNNDLLTDEIKDTWAKAILESGSAAPDAITGATLTFSAGSVQEAMEKILADMKGEATETPDATEAAEAPAAEAPAAETTEAPAAEAPAAETAEAPAAETAETPAAEDSETKAEEPVKEETGETVPVRNVPASAAYRADAENSFSKITVLASAKNGKLDSVKILSEGEGNNDLLTDEIKETWAKAILESGSAAPDAITGATLQFSAASVTEAMTEILARMNGGTAEAEEAAETEEQSAAEAAGEEPVRSFPASAAYRADAENSFSRITVLASAKNGKLDSVKILSEGEGNNDLLTDEIKEAWAKAILESGSAAPDAITGATLTFSAGSVQEAMTEILNRIAGN